MYKLKVLTLSIILVISLLLAGPAFDVAARPFAAAPAVGLGTAGNFVVLAGAAVNDTNISDITGNVGLSPAAWPPAPALTCAEVSGTIYSVDASGPLPCRVTNAGLLTTAKNDLTTAYNNAALSPTTSTIGTALGGVTLTNGVYDSAAGTFDIAVGQTLTLNGLGDPDSVFIFKMGTTLTTFANSRVVLTNSAQSCNVFWQVGSSAVLGTNSTFVGTVMADQSITDNGGSTVDGRFLARIAAVTLNNTTITRSVCNPAITTTLSSANVAVGSAVHDSATLTGDTSNSGGTVTYAAYTNNLCTLGAQAAGTKVVTNGVVPDSDPITFTSAGTFYWQAVYSGDANNNGATSACISEQLTVNKATPTLTTTASGPVMVGGNITDTAHLVGGYGALTGTLTFRVYAPGDTTCATPTVVGAPLAVIGAGDYTSANYTTTAVGIYRWRAFYSGDGNNNAVSTACNDAGETSTVTALPPTPVPAVVPATGFAPRQVTVLSTQPAEKAYANLGDLWLEIPRLGVQAPILGVPLANGTWDVSWLGENAGWLNGSAFPTWNGNSVITGHVYDAYGNPGPFIQLNGLWWGDKVIVHAWGAQYVYEVRAVMQVQPNDQATMMKHQELPWLTLVTCRGYDQASNSYKYRILVRAVLVEVK